MAWTPFGRVMLPAIQGPPAQPPKLPGQRDWVVLLQALGKDLAKIPGAIPVLGYFIEDALGDTHNRALMEALTPEERERWLIHEQYLPTTLAVARTLLWEY